VSATVIGVGVWGLRLGVGNFQVRLNKGTDN
jgi:hypothetical protein